MPRGNYGVKPNDPRRPRIRLSRSLTGIVPDHPVAVDYLNSHPGWLMLGNGPDPANAAAGVPPDGAGDCVGAWWANNRRTLTATLTPTEVYPTLKQVIQVYKTQNPGFPNEDNGMEIQLLLQWLVKNKAPDSSQALGFAAVDYTNPAEVDAALAIFGTLCPGFDVLSANETEFDEGLPWDYVSGSPDVGGHCTLLGGYGAEAPPFNTTQLSGTGAKAITWAEEISFTPRFIQKQMSELWAVIYPEHLKDNAFLAGVNMAQFAADYTAITGQPFPADVPPGPVIPPIPPTADAASQAFASVLKAQNATGQPWYKQRHDAYIKKVATAAGVWLNAEGLE